MAKEPDTIDGMGAEQLREELRLTNTQYIDLRTRYESTLTERRKHEEATWAAAERDARLRTIEYVKSTMRGVRDPLHRFLEQAAKVSEKSRPHELEEIAHNAAWLVRLLDQDPDLKAAQRVVADMDAAHQEAIASSARLWDTVQVVREAVRDTAEVGGESRG